MRKKNFKWGRLLEYFTVSIAAVFLFMTISGYTATRQDKDDTARCFLEGAQVGLRLHTNIVLDIKLGISDEQILKDTEGRLIREMQKCGCE